MSINHTFLYDKKKALRLKAERGICFEDIIAAIENKGLLAIIPHQNQQAYPNQKILIVQIDDYAYQVPYIREKDQFILKTVFPSRKFTKLFLKRKSHGHHQKTFIGSKTKSV